MPCCESCDLATTCVIKGIAAEADLLQDALDFLVSKISMHLHHQGLFRITLSGASKLICSRMRSSTVCSRRAPMLSTAVLISSARRATSCGPKAEL